MVNQKMVLQVNRCWLLCLYLRLIWDLCFSLYRKIYSPQTSGTNPLKTAHFKTVMIICSNSFSLKDLLQTVLYSESTLKKQNVKTWMITEAGIVFWKKNSGKTKIKATTNRKIIYCGGGKLINMEDREGDCKMIRQDQFYL